MKILNILIFQWLFIRLIKCRETAIGGFSLTEISITSKGSKIGGEIRKKYEWYVI